jgi:hypothetical protein
MLEQCWCRSRGVIWLLTAWLGAGVSVGASACGRETPSSRHHVIDEPEPLAPSAGEAVPDPALPAVTAQHDSNAQRFADFVISDDGTVKTIARRSSQCPRLEYAPDWKSLRFRSDSVDCEPVKLSGHVELARALLDFAAAELGAELEPTSFGLGDYPEMYERIAPRILLDNTWDAKAGKVKHGSLHTLVVSLASDPPAFHEVQKLFEGTGFRPSLASVEKVFVGPISSTPFSQALIAQGINVTLKVPYGSLVGFSLEETATEPEPEREPQTGPNTR